MTDFFDRAQQLEQQQREDALAALKPRAVGPGLSHCKDCGTAIPEKRRKAVPGCVRCMPCQSLVE